jgi:hypothetical protein
MRQDYAFACSVYKRTGEVYFDSAPLSPYDWKVIKERAEERAKNAGIE